MAYALDSKWLTIALGTAAVLAFTPVILGGAMAGFAVAVFLGVIIVLVLLPLGAELGWDLHRTKSLGERSGSRPQDLVNANFRDDDANHTDSERGN